MNRESYPSDLKEEEWEIVKLLIPPTKAGLQPRTTEIRKVLNAIFYILRWGITWRVLSHDFPP